MYNTVNEMLSQIPKIVPANEAEVETKIVLHIFRFLNYTDIDRADKPHIYMHFGREIFEKIPDFIFYDGNERTFSRALISVEAKKIGESLRDAELQVKSYATFAGTPYYVICNGIEFVASRFTPGADIIDTVRFKIVDIEIHWDELKHFLRRAEVLLCKERLRYLAAHVPYVEDLPASVFYNQYLTQLSYRFSNFNALINPLKPPSNNKLTLPNIPILVKIKGSPDCYQVEEIADFLIKANRQIFIMGSPGSGKTTLCYRLINYLSRIAQEKGANILPIYIKLIQGIPSDALDALNRACNEINVQVYPTLFEKSIQHNHIILILDGLDELLVNNISSDENSFINFLSKSSQCSILITTRPIAHDIFELLNSTSLVIGNINYLRENDICEILDEYKVSDKFLKFIQSNKLPINSPLILYMLISLKERLEDVECSTKYRLYIEYVKTLHEYFNSAALRGNEKVIQFDEILSILSDASYLISSNRQKQIKIDLNDLKSTLELTYGLDSVIMFINIGLITSTGDNVEFIHYSFEEFGIAYRIVNIIKSKDMEEFINSIITSEGCYNMIFTELTESDMNELILLLGNSKNKVRRRAMCILQYSEDKTIIESILQTLAKDNTTTVPISVVQNLVNKRDRMSICWLLGTDKIRMFDKIHILNKAIQNSDINDYIDVMLDYSSSHNDKRILEIVTKLCINNSIQNEILEMFKSFYWKQTENAKLIMCSIIRKKTDNIPIYELVSEIFENEDSTRIIVRLLPFVIYISISSSVLIRLKSLLSISTNLKTKDIKYINQFIMLAESNLLEGNIADIYNICKQIKQNLDFIISQMDPKGFSLSP